MKRLLVVGLAMLATACFDDPLFSTEVPTVQVSSIRIERAAEWQEGGDDFPKPENVTVSEWCSEAGSTEAVDRCFEAWGYVQTEDTTWVEPDYWDPPWVLEAEGELNSIIILPKTS